MCNRNACVEINRKVLSRWAEKEKNLKILQEAGIILSSDERTLASLSLRGTQSINKLLTLYDIIIKYVPHLEWKDLNSTFLFFFCSKFLLFKLNSTH